MDRRIKPLTQVLSVHTINRSHSGKTQISCSLKAFEDKQELKHHSKAFCFRAHLVSVCVYIKKTCLFLSFKTHIYDYSCTALKLYHGRALPSHFHTIFNKGLHQKSNISDLAD